jgi:uncharacterized protein
MSGNQLAVLECRKVSAATQTRERLLQRLMVRDHRAATAQSGALKLGGYAALFNEPTVIANCFIEKIAPGCFTNAIRNNDVRYLLNHDSNFVLARTKSKTLFLREDAKGLAFEALPSEASTWVNDLVEAISRGDIDQMSYQFSSVRESWDDSGDMPVRTLLDVQLFDVSAVTFPATEQTTVAVLSGGSRGNGGYVPVLPMSPRSDGAPVVVESQHSELCEGLTASSNSNAIYMAGYRAARAALATGNVATQVRERLRQRLMARAIH